MARSRPGLAFGDTLRTPCLACPRRRSWSSFREAGHSSHAGLARLPAKLSRQSGDRRGPTDTTRSNRWAACRRQALGKAVLAVSAQAKRAMIDDLGSAAFMVDLASMERETQYTRTGDLAPTPAARALLLDLLQSLSAPLALPWRKQDGHRYYCVLSRCRVQKPGS
jgi:hypothetical protein